VIPLSLLLRELQKPLQLVLYQAICAWSSNCANISETFHMQTNAGILFFPANNRSPFFKPTKRIWQPETRSTVPLLQVVTVKKQRTFEEHLAARQMQRKSTQSLDLLLRQAANA
jgi:hypothetical protein